MKASLLAISISSVLAAPVFASAPQVDVELANQQTLQLIDGQMNAIDASVQYKLNEQYANATPGTTATIDDVTYEKQSNGTWAAVGAASAALVAGLLSSTSGNSGTSGDIPVTVNPIESQPTLPTLESPELPLLGTPNHPVSIDPANPNVKWGKVEIQDTTYITKNGELQFAIYDGIVFDVNGYEPIAKISKRPDGKIYKVETANGGEVLVTNRIKNGAEFTVTKVDGTTVDMIWTQGGGLNIAGLPGQGPEGIPTHPDVDLPTPELPVMGSPEHPITVDPATPNVKWGKVEIQDTTYITKNGELLFAIYDGIVFDVNGYEPIAKISKRPDGKIYKVETVNGGEVLVTNRIKNGAEFTVTKVDGTTVDMIWTQGGGLNIAGLPGQGPEGNPGQGPNATVSVALVGEHIEVTINGESRTTVYTAERVGDSVNILNRDGNIVGIGYINTDNETLEFRNGIVVDDKGNVTLPQSVKESAKNKLHGIDRTKLQNIDPSKLQKAKSAIQQRLRS